MVRSIGIHLHWELHTDLMRCRCSLICSCSIRAPESIQAIPTAPQPFYEPRRSNPAINLLLPCQPNTCCPDGWLKIKPSDKRSSTKTLWLPVNPHKEPGQWPARHCRARILGTPENEEGSGALLEAAPRYTEPPCRHLASSRWRRSR